MRLSTLAFIPLYPLLPTLPSPIHAQTTLNPFDPHDPAAYFATTAPNQRDTTYVAAANIVQDGDIYLHMQALPRRRSRRVSGKGVEAGG